MITKLTEDIKKLLLQTSQSTPETAIDTLALGLATLIENEILKARVVIPATESNKILYVNSIGTPTPVLIKGVINGNLQILS